MKKIIALSSLFFSSLLYAADYTFTSSEGGGNGDSCGNIEFVSVFDHRATLFSKDAGVFRVKKVDFSASYLNGAELTYRLHKGSSLDGSNRKIPSATMIGTDEVNSSVSGGTQSDISNNLFVEHTYTQTDHIMDFNSESDYWISIERSGGSGNFCYGNSTGDAFSQDGNTWTGYGALYTNLQVEVLSPTISNLTATATSDGASVSVTSNQDATVYYLVQSAATAAPTSSYIENNATGLISASAGSAETFTITGMTSQTNYKVYAVAKSTSDKYLGINQSTDFRTLEPAVTANLALSTSSATTSSITASIATDVDASVYYMVVKADAPAPTATQIEAGTADYNGTVAIAASGSNSIVANTAFIPTINNLSDSTDYKIYVAAKSSTNTYSTKSASFTTLTPVSANISLQFVDLAHDKMSLTSTLDVNAGLYSLVVKSDAPVPTNAQVEAGAANYNGIVPVFGSGSKQVTANTSESITISGLEANTSYIVYVVAKSTTETYSSEKLSFTTKSVPAVQASLSLQVSSISVSGGTLTISSDLDVTAKYLLVDSAASAPTLGQIQAGGTGYASTVHASGTVDLTSNASGSAIFTNLSESTQYKAYVVAETANNVVSTTDFGFETLALPEEELVHSVTVDGKTSSVTYSTALLAKIEKVGNDIVTSAATDDVTIKITTSENGSTTNELTLKDDTIPSSLTIKLPGSESHMLANGSVVSSIMHNNLNYLMTMNADGTLSYEIKENDSLISKLSLPFVGGEMTLNSNGDLVTVFRFNSSKGYFFSTNQLTFTANKSGLTFLASLEYDSVVREIAFEVKDTVVSMDDYKIDISHGTSKGMIKTSTNVLGDDAATKVFFADNLLFDMQQNSSLKVRMASDGFEEVLESIQFESVEAEQK